MASVKTKWESTKPNPDEKYLKALWQEEIKTFERSRAEEEAASERRRGKRLPLMKAAGFSEDDIAKILKEDAALSRASLKKAEAQIMKPSVDFEPVHKQDLDLARANAERVEGKSNPAWQGYIFDPVYPGMWFDFNGEAEEVPSIGFDVGANQVDPRAQAWGEGLWDADYSRINAYLAFTFKPPSWGNLRVYAGPWLHGYYALYSDDDWYKEEHARAEVYTWIDVHQTGWRARQSQRRFRLAGYELHPERSGRIDAQYGINYYTSVGESDTVTIRVGVELYCRATASGGRSKLDFQTGSANYVWVPWVYWYLQH